MGESSNAGFDLGKPSATQKGGVILYRVEGHCAERHRPQFWECATGKHLGDDRGSPAEAALDLVNVPTPPTKTSDAGDSDAAFVSDAEIYAVLSSDDADCSNLNRETVKSILESAATARRAQGATTDAGDDAGVTETMIPFRAALQICEKYLLRGGGGEIWIVNRIMDDLHALRALANFAASKDQVGAWGSALARDCQDDRADLAQSEKNRAELDAELTQVRLARDEARSMAERGWAHIATLEAQLAEQAKAGTRADGKREAATIVQDIFDDWSLRLGWGRERDAARSILAALDAKGDASHD